MHSVDHVFQPQASKSVYLSSASMTDLPCVLHLWFVTVQGI